MKRKVQQNTTGQSMCLTSPSPPSQLTSGWLRPSSENLCSYSCRFLEGNTHLLYYCSLLGLLYFAVDIHRHEATSKVSHVMSKTAAVALINDGHCYWMERDYTPDKMISMFFFLSRWKVCRHEDYAWRPLLETKWKVDCHELILACLQKREAALQPRQLTLHY